MCMNVLSYLSYKTFTHSISNKLKVTVTGVILMLIYTWGIPAVFVAVSIVTERYNLIDFSYGDGLSCWIDGSQGLLYMFAVPLATILVVNLILFSCTAGAIHRTMKLTENAHEAHAENRSSFFICVKLATVMGFTWVFGFLANIKIISFVWYIFIVLNASQGLFICVAFVMTKRVLNLYRGLFGGTEKSKSKQTAHHHQLILRPR